MMDGVVSLRPFCAFSFESIISSESSADSDSMLHSQSFSITCAFLSRLAKAVITSPTLLPSHRLAILRHRPPFNPPRRRLSTLTRRIPMTCSPLYRHASSRTRTSCNRSSSSS